MDDKELNGKIDAYLEQNWEAMVADLDALVRIASVEELDKASQGAPFGPGPREALTAALQLAEGMGFEAHDLDGYLGYVDLPGASDTQIGIIGHMDVVPAGPGWSFEPYEVTRKEGYLLGRGVADDKGPSVVALHALKFWKDQGAQFPYTIRFLLGANEESGMRDVAYYQERFEDPAFLFTPDAEFPVCYGEKGLYDARVTSAPIENGVIVALEGGMASNAVPGLAHAVVRAEAKNLPPADRITVSEEAPGLARIDAEGKSAHASLPADGVNAIGLVVDYLLANGLCNDAERTFLEFEQKLLGNFDGSGLGIACSDEHFGALTVVGGVVSLEDGRFKQTIDSRFPTAIEGDELVARIGALAAEAGCTHEVTRLSKPFLVDPSSPAIQALLEVYNQTMGEDAKPFTMGGGTYARHFKSAASFGPEKPWEELPAWVGSMHGPDEGISEELLKQAFRVYVLAIDRLMRLDLA